MKVNVKHYGPALVLDQDTETETALVQLLREGPAQNLRVPLASLSAEPASENARLAQLETQVAHLRTLIEPPTPEPDPVPAPAPVVMPAPEPAQSLAA